MPRHRGQSLVMWTATLSLVIVIGAFIRVTLKRALQERIIATADYSLWSGWDKAIKQHKGDDTTFVKTSSEQTQFSGFKEKDAVVSVSQEFDNSEESAYTSVEEGSEPLLKRFDLN